MVAPLYEESVAFLSRWRPGGPWVLTAIDPEKKGIETRTFRGDTPELRAWLSGQGSTRNLYFSVNPTIKDISKKADREDIAALAWLHVDIDPRAGEDIAQEQARALALLQSPPGGIPPPTVIVFSGGGYQGFWKLETPVQVDGNLDAAEDAKRYNLQIEVQYAADNCHNIDRIMRLPGSVNRPDAKKRKKGRTEALAAVVEWHDDRVYPIDKFVKAPLVQAGMAGSFPATRVSVSGNVKRLATVDELPDLVPAKVKVIIVQGKDPDEPNKHPSRSEWLFYVCCELVRSNCDDDTIFSVITDPNFAISASVLEKGGNANKYALHQIERAKEDAIDKDLRILNERHAVIGNWSGKCRVVEEVWDEAMKRHRLVKQTFEDFRNRYLAQYKTVGVDANGKPIIKPMGHWWLGDPHRRQYDRIVFAPGREVSGAYNLWRGFACDARQGDCSLYLEHLKNNLCQGNPVHYAYLLGWMARAVQHPDSPGYSAVVLRGGMGTGKSFIAKTFGSLFGRHYMPVTDPKHLVGSFNAHLRDCVVLFGDEAFFAGDKKHESILKMLITEEITTIEAKGYDAESCPNYVHLMMASNDSWVVPAAVDDRRFFVLDISGRNKEDHGYFEKIQKQMDTGGREALLHFLLTHDLKGFNVRQVPKTDALQQQKMYSFNVEEEWWFSKLREGRLLVDHNGWRSDICTVDLLTDYQSYCRGFSVIRRGNATKLAHSLQRFVPDLPEHPEQRRITVEVNTPEGKKMLNRPYFWKFPDLATCRAHWDKQFGGPYTWPRVLVDSDEESQPQLNGRGSPF